MKTLGLGEFATRYRLKTSMDECGETVIWGKHGQVYEWGPGRLGAMYIPDEACRHRGKPKPAKLSARKWGNARRALQKGGFELIQNGDWEGMLLFDAENVDQASLAIRILRIKRRRKLSPEQAAKAAETLRKFRFPETQACAIAESHALGLGLKLRKCLQCHGPIESRRADAQFCSEGCKKRYQRKRLRRENLQAAQTTF
jgi:hypothetical protein